MSKRYLWIGKWRNWNMCGRRWGLQATLFWEPRDVWIGLFFDPIDRNGYWRVYVCLLPCLPILVSLTRSRCAAVTTG